jgi:hypothetical protein
MAGFVDVTEMSDAQVKRLCQADDPTVDTLPARYSRAGRSTATKSNQYDGSLAFAAACAAYTVLGNKYVKAGAWSNEPDGSVRPVQSNRDMIQNLLANPDRITQADRDMAELVLKYYRGFMFKIVSGVALNEFDSKALALANSQTISERDLGVLAYLPQGYDRATQRQSAEDRIHDARGGHIGQLGSKHTFSAEVLRSVYSTNWSCFFVTGITSGDQVVFFSHKDGLPIGTNITATGTVKAHHSDGKTQFTRVKFL